MDVGYLDAFDADLHYARNVRANAGIALLVFCLSLVFVLALVLALLQVTRDFHNDFARVAIAFY